MRAEGNGKEYRAGVRSGDLAEIPLDIAPRVGLHRRVRSGLVEAGDHAELVLLDDALVGLARHPPEPGQLAPVVVGAFLGIATDQPDDLHLAGLRFPGDEAIDDA